MIFRLLGQNEVEHKKLTMNIKTILALLLGVLTISFASCKDNDDDYPSEVKNMMGVYAGDMEVKSEAGDTTVKAQIMISKVIGFENLPLLHLIKQVSPLDPASKKGKEIAEYIYRSSYSTQIIGVDSLVRISIPTSSPTIYGVNGHDIAFEFEGTSADNMYNVENETLSFILKAKSATVDGKAFDKFKEVTMIVKDMKRVK